MIFEKPKEMSRFVALLLGDLSSTTTIVAHAGLVRGCVLKVCFHKG